MFNSTPHFSAFFDDGTSQTLTSTTYATVTDGTTSWTFSVDADSDYLYLIQMYWSNQDSGSDLKIRIDGEPASTNGRFSLSDIAAATSISRAIGSDTCNIATGNQSDYPNQSAGGVFTGGSSGNITIQLAWNNSGSNIVLDEYSNITVWKLSEGGAEGAAMYHHLRNIGAY